jgi:hypothetical protein
MHSLDVSTLSQRSANQRIALPLADASQSQTIHEPCATNEFRHLRPLGELQSAFRLKQGCTKAVLVERQGDRVAKKFRPASTVTDCRIKSIRFPEALCRPF